jgi:2-polyprenyl-3-methyl-5-hydroxy-6-metoxy-1,4-benzoquinol methylase
MIIGISKYQRNYTEEIKMVEETNIGKWTEVWDKNYELGYAEKLDDTKAIITAKEAYDMKLHPYFGVYLFPKWRELKKTDHALEIGCGDGVIAVRMFTKVGRFVGIDISNVAIDKITKRFEGIKNVRFEANTDLLSLKEKFDFIYSITVFQHIPKEFTKKYIEQSYQILNKGGAMFFNVVSGIQNENIAEVKFNPNGICEPSMGFSKEQIEQFCKEAGFENVQITKMDVQGANDRYWWYFVLCQK